MTTQNPTINKKVMTDEKVELIREAFRELRTHLESFGISCHYTWRCPDGAKELVGVLWVAASQQDIDAARKIR